MKNGARGCMKKKSKYPLARFLKKWYNTHREGGKAPDRTNEQKSKRERNTDMAKKMNNGAAKVVRRYCETFVEEWYEFDVVKGGKVLATFTDEAKAIKFMGSAA